MFVPMPFALLRPHGTGAVMLEAEKPYRKCPRFARCSVNHCLLDPDKDKRADLPGEPRCTLGKPYRVAIAVKYPDLLPWGGLKPSEVANKQAWDALPPEEKQRRLQRLSLARQAKKRRARLQTGVPAIHHAEGQ